MCKEKSLHLIFTHCLIHSTNTYSVGDATHNIRDAMLSKLGIIPTNT